MRSRRPRAVADGRTPIMKLENRVALVTGAGSGIGEATALLFAREGAKVAVVDLREDAAKATAEKIEREGGQALGDPGRRVEGRGRPGGDQPDGGALGPPRRLLSPTPACPSGPRRIEDVDEAVFDQIMAVNVKGVFLGAKYAAPVFKRQRSGVFLATGSTSGIRPRPGVQSYSASKGAVHTLVKSLALELAPFGVRAVAIAPVATETPMLPVFMGKKEVDEEGMTRYRATVPLGRLNRPEDLARAALFLASDDAAMITGSTIEVDGGRCI